MKDAQGEPWLVARDVLDVLGIRLLSRGLANIPEMNVMDQRLAARGRPNKLVNEQGFYRLDAGAGHAALCDISATVSCYLSSSIRPPVSNFCAH